MDETREAKLKRYEKVKSKIKIHNYSKITPKPKVRYGAMVDKVYSGCWHNGVWQGKYNVGR